MISLDDFKKVEITVGKILSVEKVPETDKLLKLHVDFGSPLVKGETRTLGASQDLERSSSSAKGVQPRYEGPNSDSGRVVGEGKTTPALEDSGTPFFKWDGDTPERDVRQIISGIAAYFPDPQALVGKKCMFVTNLEPRTIKGLESNGMLLAVSTEGGTFSLLEPNGEIPEGTRAR